MPLRVSLRSVAVNAALPSEATSSLHHWLHLWNTPELAARTTIEWSPRLTRSLGRCYPERRLIRLASFLDEAPNGLLEEVLCHELAHVAARELHGTRIRPHGPEWKALMRDAGYEPKTRLPLPANVRGTPQPPTPLSLHPPLPRLSAFPHGEASRSPMALRRVCRRRARRHPRHLPAPAMSEPGCPFCDPDPERVFYRGANVLGIWDAYPVSDGHALIVTKRHVHDVVRPHRVDFDDLIASAMDAGAKIPAHLWEDFRSEFENFMVAHGRPLPSAYDAAHIYACFFQLRRGFYYIYRYILGSSAPIVRLRAAVWQSIFTHDLRRYTHSLYGRMTDSTLLITGPSGTGKELVARAVGLSRYHPFNTRTKAFETDFSRSFHPVNLSALPTTLIESELFGHVKGAFTGAVREREGLLEECGGVRHGLSGRDRRAGPGRSGEVAARPADARDSAHRRDRASAISRQGDRRNQPRPRSGATGQPLP